MVLLSVFVLSSLLVIQTEAKKSSNMASMKKKWPELVGKLGEEAKEEILKERPGLEIQVIPEDSMMTMDFREDRVRILVDANQKVSQAPRVG